MISFVLVFFALPRASQFVFARLITFCNFVTEWLLKAHTRQKNREQRNSLTIFVCFLFRRAQIAFVIKLYYTFFHFFLLFRLLFFVVLITCKAKTFSEWWGNYMWNGFAVKLVQRLGKGEGKVIMMNVWMLLKNC